MLARKCDRCGQFYDAPKDDEVCGFVWLTGGGGMSFKNVDLCPDCTDKLSDWLEGAEHKEEGEAPEQPEEEQPKPKKIRQYSIEEQVKMRLSGMTPKEIAKITGAKKESVSRAISLFKAGNPDRYAELQKESEGNSCAP